MSKNPSNNTMQKVYERWKGKCAFCGVYGTIEQHHVVAKSEDPSLIDNPDNLVLLCTNHHTLTLKKNPDGFPAISFKEINDVIRSKYVNSNKLGVYFDVPQNYRVVLGGNTCQNYPYILVVNKKPLIELWAKQPVHYVDELGLFVTMRFFDEKNNFLGGMFDNHWASVADEKWEISFSQDVIEVRNKENDLFIKFEKRESLYITGVFYFDGIRIEARNNELTLPRGNKFISNTLDGCAFSVFGDKDKSGFSIGGIRL